MSTRKWNHLHLLLPILLLLSMSIGSLLPVSARSIQESNRTDIESLPATASPLIHAISTNETDYADGKIPRYEKFEITFQVDTEAKNLQMPYDANPPPGVEAGIGINVDATFTSPAGKIYSVPGFYYQEFEHQVKESKDWIYPTATYAWKVRFAPNEIGMWSYQLKARDLQGEIVTPLRNVEVTTSTNHGFLRVSKDPRYFEFEDGTYFPGLGYNMNFDQISWNNPILENQSNFETMSANGIQLIRMWLSQWGIYGSAWNPWNTITSGHSNYIPQEALTFGPGKVYPGHELAMNIWYPGAYPNPCMFLGFIKASPAIKPGTSYMLSVTYKFTNDNNIPIVKDKASGFVVKLGGWLKGDGNDCYLPDTGEVIAASYPPPPDKQWETVGASGDWQTTTAIWENKGGLTFLPNLYVALENVSSGAAYIDEVTLREVGAAGPGVNVISSSRMDHHLDMDQRFSFAFDKVLELAKANNVYLRPVLMEKGEWIFNHINHTGNYTNTVAADNEYFYGDYRDVTKVRWLQQAWWRYAQARWGYSTNIQSWELANEANPDSTRHYTLADEFGKYMHCGVFSEPLANTPGTKCTLEHPNAHLISTSNWEHDPQANFWTNPQYPNIDFVDIHLYHNEAKETWIRIDGTWTKVNDAQEYYDSASLTEKLSKLLRTTKPVIRGEVGFVDADGVYNPDVPATKCAPKDDLLRDTQGDWLHDFVWGGINSGGLIESYWYANVHIYSSPSGCNPPPYAAFDHRDQFGTYYTFIKDIPLNNTNYVDAQATTNVLNLRAWGQKDLSANRAHLWIQNTLHTWWNVVSSTIPITPVTGIVSIPGFAPSSGYLLERWNTYSGVVESTETINSDGAGAILIPVTNLTDDFAIKLSPVLTTVRVNSTADPGDGICTTSECTLREAIILANSTTGAMTIEVPSGVYLLTVAGANEDLARTGDLDITDELTIIGAGAENTIIDGNQIDRVFHVAKSVTVKLSGLTLQNGNASPWFGGGIFSQGNLTLINSTVRSNTGEMDGGISNDGGQLTLDDCTVRDNQAGETGGISSIGKLTIRNSRIENNKAVYDAGVTTQGEATILNSVISGNAGGNGGGVRVFDGSLFISDSILDQNDNEGMFIYSADQVTIFNTTISNNRYDGINTIGLGISSKITLINSTISGNSGSGIRAVDGSSFVLTNTTVTDNGGDGLIVSSRAQITLGNSVIAGKGRTSNACLSLADANSQTIVSLGHNLINDTSCRLTNPTDLTLLDPQLGPLQDNGSPIWTHKPLAGSPLIDAGDNARCPATDQVGQHRPIDGDGDGKIACDIGAFEVQQPYTDKAHITIIKDALPDSPRNFRYWGAFGSFQIDDPGEDDGDSVKNFMRYNDVMAPGTYTFSEEKIANWFLTDIKCDRYDRATVKMPDRSVTLNVKPGDNVICTFTNKYASSLTVLPYWDIDQDGQHDPTEDFQDGWWSEFYDSSGTLKASNFTQNGGHWDLYNIRPGSYTVCQKPREGWYNTKPIITDPTHKNWPCYTFELSYAQVAKAYFGYSDQPFVENADEQSAQSGLEIIQVGDPEQDALATWEEFLAVHPGDRLPDEDEAKTNIYLPMLVR